MRVDDKVKTNLEEVRYHQHFFKMLNNQVGTIEKIFYSKLNDCDMASVKFAKPVDLMGSDQDIYIKREPFTHFNFPLEEVDAIP